MALQFSTVLRNAMIDQIPVIAGSSEVVKIFDGPPPTNCGVGDTGTLLIEFDLPVTSWQASSSGSKTLAMLPQTMLAVGTGTAGYFRLYDAGATTAHVQGTIEMIGAIIPGDMTVDNSSIIIGQTTLIVSFTLTMPGE